MAQRKWPGPGSCCLARAIYPFMGSPDACLLIYQNKASSKPAQGRDIADFSLNRPLASGPHLSCARLARANGASQSMTRKISDVCANVWTQKSIHSVIDEDRSSRRERNGTAAGKRVREIPIESNVLKQPP
jgi:hypothetical protein